MTPSTMSPLDDVLSVEDDFTFEDITLDPSLVPIATPNTGRKRKNGKPSASVGTPQRGRAWREEDSILLVKAYAWVEETKKSTLFSVFF
jgi:hypothetical protein